MLLSHKSGFSDTPNISRPFARVMLGLVCLFLTAAAIGMLSLPYVIRSSILKNAANNYAQFTAQQVASLVGTLEDPGYWQFNLDRLSGVLTRSSRASGVARIQILSLDGTLIMEKSAEKIPDEIIQGKHQIRFNNQPLGWVVVSLAVPDIEESWGSFGFLTVAHLTALTTKNYGVLISDQIAIILEKLDTPEFGEHHAEKFSAVLANALFLDGITNIAILDGQGVVLAEKEKGKKVEGAVTSMRASIIRNNNVAGWVNVHLDFPGIRAIVLRFQLAAFFLILLSGAMIYFLPTRTVRGLENSLLKLYSDLEMKVLERTGELEKANEELKKELAERKRLEASLLQTEKMSAVGQLAAGVAHEINNPLAIILGFSQSALKKIKDSDALFMPIKSIEREALRCKNLVQNLLVFSRQTDAQMQIFNLNETLADTLSIIEAHARVKSVEIFMELGTPPPLLGDRNQIQQVIVNLCNNAIDALPNGGKIVVRTISRVIKDKREAILEIEDNGSGIPEELRNRIFNPFFTTKEAGKGTGLGLSLVYEIVQKHRGTIDLKSTVGHGTTFSISLPGADS